MPKLAALLMVLYITVASIPTMGVAHNDTGLTVIVTFPYMLKDVESLLCEGDKVISLIPPGIDPHEHQLTPSDIEFLSKADLVVSTAHTHFELKIREMVSLGELKAKLIEVPNIRGLTLLTHPSTGVTNFHGILFYEDNYIMFLTNLSNTLAILRPECSSLYASRAMEIVHKVRDVSAKKPLKGLKAVIDSPYIQYLALWLGADVHHVLMLEHDIPMAPQDIVKAEEILKKFRNGSVVMVIEGSITYGILNDLASKYSTKIIVVPNPVTHSDSILTYFEHVQTMIQASTTATAVVGKVPIADKDNFKIAILMTALILIVLILIWMRKWIRIAF